LYPTPDTLHKEGSSLFNFGCDVPILCYPADLLAKAEVGFTKWLESVIYLSEV